ncbi:MULTISPECIES: GPW/gp25 family protein [unclassified Lysinibacillus]|uniref:GPW/gp25 family protein n=1 Tax=unclassified Lysinibacillus TaxID=2636778 RepID=UPI0037F9BAEA
MYEVEPMKNIDFGATGVDEILQNVAFIMATAMMSCPLDREFGLDMTVIDRPINIAKARITADITAAVHKFEPRALIESIEVTGDGLAGSLKPKAKVSINESV